MIRKTIGLVSALLLAGCVFIDPAGGPVIYDLPPAQISGPMPAGIRVGAIRNLSGAGRQLLVRDDDNVMHDDSDAKWLVPPEVALERSLRNIFLDHGNAVKVLDVILQRFEFHSVNGKKYAVLGVIYQIRVGRNWQEYSGEYRAEVRGRDYGEAMKRCVEESISTLLAKLELEKK